MANGCRFANFRLLVTSARSPTGPAGRRVSRASLLGRVTTLVSRRGQTETTAGATVDDDDERLQLVRGMSCALTVTRL